MKRFWKDNRGALAPGFVLLLVAMMAVGSLFFSLASIYSKRTVVRDALDAAATSALAAGAQETWKSTYYYEYEICVRGHTEKDPGPPPTSTYVCDEWGWAKGETNPANYILIDPGRAKSVAEEYLRKNLDLNLKGTYKIKSFKFNYEYDKRRFIIAKSERYNTSAPSSWWGSEFGDSTPAPFTAVSERKIRAPRWVKVTVETDVEVYTPLGKMFGDGTMDFKWKTTAVKELKGVSGS